MPSGSSAHPVMHDGNGSRCNGNMKHDYFEKPNKERSDEFGRGFIAAIVDRQFSKMLNYEKQILDNSEDWKNGFKRGMELHGSINCASKEFDLLLMNESEKYRKTLTQGENG